MNIINAEFFIMTKKILNGLIRYEREINDTLQALEEKDFFDKIYFWDLPEGLKEPISFMCQSLMSEKDSDVSYVKMTIAAALCYYVQNESNTTPLRDWMRFVRNIANNSKVEADTIHNVLSAFRKWALECSEKRIEDLVNSIDRTSGIDSGQIDEERHKLKYIVQPDALRSIHHLENHRFFFGRVGFLLSVLKEEFPGEVADETEAQTLVRYSDILYMFFGNHGPKFDSKGDGYLAHRVLLACSEYYGIGYKYKRSRCLLESKEEWKKYYLEGPGAERDAKDKPPHNIGLIRLLHEIGTSEQLSAHKLEDIRTKYANKVNDWRRPLIEQPGLWSYMGSRCLKFHNNHNVLLMPGVVLQSDGRRAELRARSLYLDLKFGECLRSVWAPDSDDDYRPLGWRLRFWESRRREV